jgi:putative hydrolase of the HAD superfamily
MSMIRAVLFDLDGTLYDRDALVTELAAEQHRVFGDHFPRLDRNQFVATVVTLDDHGYRNKTELYTQLAADHGLDATLSRRMEADFWERYDRLCRPPDDTIETLSELRQRGMTLGVITNGGTARQSAKLQSLGLSSFFDTILISEAEGLKKPDRRIFQRALDRCGVLASEAMFVGDHPDADVAGARGAGMTAVWKRVPHWEMTFEDVPTIDNLTELLPLCRRAASLQTANLTLQPKTRAQMEAAIDQMSADDKAQLSAEWLAHLHGSSAMDPWVHGFSVVRRESGEAIGSGGFKGPPCDGVVEIAYGVDSEYRSNGYATEIANALVTYALAFAEVDVVRAQTLPENRASQRVLMKCGFDHVDDVVDPDDGLVCRFERHRG